MNILCCCSPFATREIKNPRRAGKALRAAADNSTAALYMGIDVDRAHRIAWSLGVGITAVAGGLLAWGHFGGHPALVKVIFWIVIVVATYVVVMLTAMTVVKRARQRTWDRETAPPSPPPLQPPPTGDPPA